MVTKRNDTLSAQVISATLIECSRNGSPNFCFSWLYNLFVISILMIIIFGVLSAISTYQLCCLKKTAKMKADLKCISLTYLYCVWILYILQILVSVLFLEPYEHIGWEWSDTNGWIYEENTPGWQWQSDFAQRADQTRDSLGGWIYNDKGSWQWNDDGDGGWYFDDDAVKINFDIQFILYFIFIAVFTLYTCSQLFFYLYPFKRLYHGFYGSIYQINKNSVNGHYFNVAIMFFLSVIAVFFHMIPDPLTSYKFGTASNIFTILGCFVIMYQFNKRLLFIIVNQGSDQREQSSKSVSSASPTSATENDINDKNDNTDKNERKKEEKMKLTASQKYLLEAITKHSTLATIQIIIYCLATISNIILQDIQKNGDNNDILSESHSTTLTVNLWIVAIYQCCVAICIFLGFDTNNVLYYKVCCLCHRHCNNYCKKIAKKQSMQQATELAIIQSQNQVSQQATTPN